MCRVSYFSFVIEEKRSIRAQKFSRQMEGSENPLPIGQSFGNLSGFGGAGSVGWRIKVWPVARPSR